MVRRVRARGGQNVTMPWHSKRPEVSREEHRAMGWRNGHRNRETRSPGLPTAVPALRMATWAAPAPGIRAGRCSKLPQPSTAVAAFGRHFPGRTDETQFQPCPMPGPRMHCPAASLSQGSFPAELSPCPEGQGARQEPRQGAHTQGLQKPEAQQLCQVQDGNCSAEHAKDDTSPLMLSQGTWGQTAWSTCHRDQIKLLGITAPGETQQPPVTTSAGGCRAEPVAPAHQVSQRACLDQWKPSSGHSLGF